MVGSQGSATARSYRTKFREAQQPKGLSRPIFHLHPMDAREPKAVLASDSQGLLLIARGAITATIDETI